jgi:hypothetical protein
MIGEKGDPEARIPARLLMIDGLDSSDGHAKRELMVREGWSGSSVVEGPGNFSARTGHDGQIHHGAEVSE